MSDTDRPRSDRRTGRFDTVVDGGLRLQILGPLRLWRGDQELDAGPRQQLCLLAVLLARAGQPVSTGDLIDLLWGEQPPDSALNVIHKYIGGLRRVFEPSVPARSSGSHLFRRGNGYLFTSGSAVLDWETFRELVGMAKHAVADNEPDVALNHYARALELWKGAAGDGLEYTSPATSVFTEINTRFFEVCVVAAELAVRLTAPQCVLAPLRLAAAMAPLNEPVHAALISVMGAAGQQAEALTLFRATRDRLAKELGIDPGHALQTAYQTVLSPIPHRELRELCPARSSSGEGVVPPVPQRPSAFVGRSEELVAIRDVVASMDSHGPGLVLVEGEPGAGKTRLLEELRAAARDRGAAVAWGNCPPSVGTPAVWPWVQAISTVLQMLAEGEQKHWLAGEIGHLLASASVERSAALPDSGARFRLYEQVVAVIGEAARIRPVMLVIDDLHWADIPSLELFSHLASRLPDDVALVGALRDRAPVPSAELTRLLAAASRVPRLHRLRLGPLRESDVAQLVRIETGREPSADAVRAIHRRTAGNPFFVRELSRLLTHTDVRTAPFTVPAEVPVSVRDVVLDRTAELAEEVRSLLFIAAYIGREVDLGLLAHAAGLDVETCLDRLESLAGLGILVSTADPYEVRFAHDLVRDAVVAMATPHRATRVHARIALALESCAADSDSVAERLAHHLWEAGPLMGPERVADALMRAARAATVKFAFEAAEQHLRRAMHVARMSSIPDVELGALAQLTALVGMRSMYGDSGLSELLERAEQLAASLGRERDAAGFLYSRWAAHAQAMEFDTSLLLAQRLLQQGCASADPVIRCYGFAAWGIQRWDAGQIGEAFRFLDRSKQALLDDLSREDWDPVSRDLQWLMTGMLAEMTALHGDIDAARGLFDILESAAGSQPYMTTVWATLACRSASIAGEPQWAMAAAERGMAVDPGFNFVFLGTYQRLAKCWAMAMTGDQPAVAATEAEQMIAAKLLEPPRSCVATWYALLAEMRIEAQQYESAAAALERAEWCLETYDQRYAEGLILFMRARLLHARGAPLAHVHLAAQHARSVSIEREAHLFARRAEALLDELVSTAGDGAA